MVFLLCLTWTVCAVFHLLRPCWEWTGSRWSPAEPSWKASWSRGRTLKSEMVRRFLSARRLAAASAAAVVGFNCGGFPRCHPAGAGDDDDDVMVPREGDEKAVMELDLIEGSVATAAAVALTSAATKAKVRRGY